MCADYKCNIMDDRLGKRSKRKDAKDKDREGGFFLGFLDREVGSGWTKKGSVESRFG